MNVNVKRPLSLLNPTVSFREDQTKCCLTVSSPHTQQFRTTKQESYEGRLYWQFKFCEDHNGQTFYYTLTYNDSAMPHYLGQNCFDYEDLRDLFTGGFRKKLLRDYGTTFKYFVGAELGEGAGSRGMENNPHYHVLFFLEPAEDSEFEYVRISPEEFRTLVKTYWQGFDENIVGFRDYRTAKYGIACEGDYCGLVKDFRAISYVSKYVTKDVKLKHFERKVIDYWSEHLPADIELNRTLRESFFHDYLVYHFNTDSLSFDDLPSDDFQDDLVLSVSQLSVFLCPDVEPIDYYITVPRIVDYLGLNKDFAEYESQFFSDRLREKLNEFRNRYCNKCRISNGVGEYALKFMDKKDPKVTVPSKNGFKQRPLSLYYYRKLFTDYYVNSNGSVIRYLNDDGIDYKLSKLHERLNKKVDSAVLCIDLVKDNPALYNKILASDVNVDVKYSYEDFVRLLNSQPFAEITYRYAEFKTIYEGRFFRSQWLYTKGRSGYIQRVHQKIPMINPLYDYEYFLIPSCWIGSSDSTVPRFLDSTPENFQPYHNHPYFVRYCGLFSVIDLVSDYLFIQKDDKIEEEEALYRAVARYHKKDRIHDYYGNFNFIRT